MRTRIIIPTYNEAENIVPLIKEIFLHAPPQTRVLVVDDHSPDGTAELVRKLMQSDERVSIVERSGKLGFGSAYRTAFSAVLKEGTDDLIVTIDADFSHHPRYVPKLIEAAQKFDLVVGSRYVRGGAIENWEPWRRLLSWGGNLYVRTITRLPIHDCTAGFSCMRTDFLKKIPFESIQAQGYAWWFTLRVFFHRAGGKFGEIPIMFTERRLGQSKISGGIIYEGLIEPWRIRFSKL